MNKNRFLKHNIYFNYDHNCFFCGTCNEYINIPRTHTKTEKHINNFKKFNNSSNIFIVDF
jgi:hypothetical protein